MESRLRPNSRGEIHNHSLTGRDVVIEVNSLGLRYAELGPKEPDEFRVLVLGDSITFCDFILESESWTRRMEALTAGRKKKIRFINAGLPGAGTAEELTLFKEIGSHVNADLVLVAMYLNDAQSGGLFFAKKLPDPWAKSRFFTWVSDRFQLLDTAFFKNAMPGAIDPKWRETFRAGRKLKSGDMFTTPDGFDFEIYNAYMDFGLGWNPKRGTSSRRSPPRCATPSRPRTRRSPSCSSRYTSRSWEASRTSSRRRAAGKCASGSAFPTTTRFPPFAPSGRHITRSFSTTTATTRRTVTRSSQNRRWTGWTRRS